jgi:hypothetical protein
MHAKMFHVLAVGEIFYPKSAKFGTPNRVKKQHRQNCAVAFGLECVARGSFEQRCGLRVRQRRGFALVRAFLGAVNPMCGIIQHGIFLAQVIKKV